jgi:UDP-N-acetyl-D-glucosamine dehydrogenase
MGMTASLYASLMGAIERRTAKVAVIGVGYVGLVAAVEAARVGFPVTALDLDAERVRMLNAGRSYISDVPDGELQALVEAGRLTATTDFDTLSAADVLLICVPTPLTVNRVPDLTCVRTATREVAARLRSGQLISLESTTYPGTTEEELLPAFAAGGLVAGQDFFLTFCPERIDPGNRSFRLDNMPRVIGGVTPCCTEVGAAFYAAISGGLLPVSSTRVAELAKLFENTYRAVNIALVNEMALLCDRMELDVWEVLGAAASKPFGIHAFWPGPGVGGHCIPLDPHYLSWKAREFDFPMRFVELAGEVNGQMPYFVVQKLTRLLNTKGVALRGARVLVLGVAYKKDVADTRESPAFPVMRLLRQGGAHVLYHDPLVPALTPHGRDWPEVMNSTPLTPDLLASVDAAVVVTDHTAVNYRLLAEQVPLLLDTRGVPELAGVDPLRIRRL